MVLHLNPKPYINLCPKLPVSEGAFDDPGQGLVEVAFLILYQVLDIVVHLLSGRRF